MLLLTGGACSAESEGLSPLLSIPLVAVIAASSNYMASQAEVSGSGGVYSHRHLYCVRSVCRACPSQQLQLLPQPRDESNEMCCAKDVTLQSLQAPGARSAD